MKKKTTAFKVGWAGGLLAKIIATVLAFTLSAVIELRMFAFGFLLALKLDGAIYYSWWVILAPMWGYFALIILNKTLNIWMEETKQN